MVGRVRVGSRLVLDSFRPRERQEAGAGISSPEARVPATEPIQFKRWHPARSAASAASQSVGFYLVDGRFNERCADRFPLPTPLAKIRNVLAVVADVDLELPQSVGNLRHSVDAPGSNSNDGQALDPFECFRGVSCQHREHHLLVFLHFLRLQIPLPAARFFVVGLREAKELS